MPPSRRPVPSLAAPAAAPSPVDLEALSREAGLSLATLRTFAAIHDPANRHRFSVAAAHRAFAGVKRRPQP